MNKKKYFIPEVVIPDTIEFTESENAGSVSNDSNDVNDVTEEENEENADKVEDIVEYQKKKK